MSDLLASFRLETEELLDLSSAALLALEQEPTDETALRELLRHLHTVKGSSGLFDAVPMTRLTHAAEEVLVGVRDLGVALTPAMVDDLLTACDTLRAWLALLTEDGLRVAPEAADAQESRLRRWTGSPGRPSGLPRASATEVADWLPLLPGTDLDTLAAWLDRTRARVRILRFEPASDALYGGADPVAELRGVPALDLVGCQVRPGADDFECSLVFVATTRAAVSEIAAALEGAAGTTSVAELDASALRAARKPDGSGIALRVVEGQVAALSAPCAPEQLDARLRAAAAAVRGALRALSSPVTADDVDRAVLASQEQRSAEPLRALLAGLLAPPGGGTDADSPRAEPAPNAPALPRPGETEQLPAPAAEASHSLRVERARLDQLLRLTGELGVEASALPFLAEQATEAGLPLLAKQISVRAATSRRTVDDLQTLAMEIRMVPLATVFTRYPRLVRDFSRTSGRPVRFASEGGDLTVDADVVDVLGDALVHVLRNALDHGIEDAEIRRRRGKPAEGSVTVRARAESDALVVQVSDDGGGIDGAALQQAARHLGLDPATSDHALAFEPGLSTARPGSELSGRGVGLDAVRAALAAHKGSVALDSEPGVGTTVTLRLPRSLSVTTALLVRAGGQRFAVPLEHVSRTLRAVKGDRHDFGAMRLLSLDGRSVPLLRLAEVLSVPEPDGGSGERDGLVLVTRTSAGELGLEIDAIEGREEIRIKPLDERLTGSGPFLGSVLRGDGSVLLVLDTSEVGHVA